MIHSTTLKLLVVALAGTVLAGCGACAARRDSAQTSQSSASQTPEYAAMEAPTTPAPAPAPAATDEERDQAFEESQRK